MPRADFTHVVDLRTSVDGAYRAMSFLEETMKLEGEVDWTPDMRRREEGVISFIFKDEAKAVLFKLSWVDGS